MRDRVRCHGGGRIDDKETSMSTETSQAPRRRADELLSGLAERIGAKLTASTAYGAPIERDGVTVVPAAAARFGIGAGHGSDPAKGQEGEGGGGGGGVTPVGYIELKDGRSKFVPVVHPARMLAIVSCTILAGLLIVRPARGRRPAKALPWR
jgi:uncharacterized spore protein YtfJ